FLACQPRELGQGEPDGRLVETRARLLDEHEGPPESRFRRTSRHPTCRPQAHVSKRQLGFTLRHPGPEATGEPDGFFRHRARLLEGSSGLAARRGHAAQELVRPAEELVLTVFAREVERLVEPPLARVPLTHLEEHPALHRDEPDGRAEAGSAPPTPWRLRGSL